MKGYTLAEVLITLGVIGVVSAVTIPTLVHKWQMKMFEVGFKKQYSVVQNAINYLQNEENLNDCYMYLENNAYRTKSTDCISLRDGIVNQLKLNKINNNFSYKQKQEILDNGGVVLNTYYQVGAYFSTANTYMGKDGAVYHITFPHLNIDINGKKGPNKWGYDVFWLTLSKHPAGNLQLGDKFFTVIEKGGKLPRTILRNEEDNTNYSWTDVLK